MKKLLLGTSALVAVGLCAGEASAQGYASLGGFIRGWAQFYDLPSSVTVNGSKAREFSIASNNEVWFKGETKLNSGLTFGFRIELEAWSQTSAGAFNTQDQIDEDWAYIKGSFGEFRFGEEDDARKLKAWSPYIGGLLGADSPDAVYALGTTTSYINVENDAQKIIYFSPTFSGFSFAVSYAPDAVHGTRDFALQGKNDCDGSQSRGCNGQAFSVAGDYRGKFGDTTIGVDGGWTTSQNEIAANNDVSAWRVDAFAQVAGFEFGGLYWKGNNDAGNNLDTKGYGGGVLYNFAGTPWQVGAIFQRGTREAAAGNTKLSHYVLGVNYALGGGVQALASYNYQKKDNPTTSDQSASTIVFGIAASF